MQTMEKLETLDYLRDAVDAAYAAERRGDAESFRIALDDVRRLSRSL